MKIIDLRSDTVTLPTEEMRRAMAEAVVGDDVYGEDPTVNTLEEMAARLLNKEAALFTTSGTMNNLLAVLSQTRHGDEIIVGSEAHIFQYEVGGASAVGGVVMRTLQNDAGGRLDLNMIETSIRGSDIHSPRTVLLCLENTHNRCGGAVLTPEYTSAAAGLAHRRGLRVHLDGARLFNASVALKVPAKELVKDVDSVGFCLSKGLSAPVGSVLCGTREFIQTARKWRKMLGGGMRQAGVLAAAGVVALNSTINRLEEDHLNAKRLAEGLARIPIITIQGKDIPTNIVMFHVTPAISALDFRQKAKERGVLLGYIGGQKLRAVTHRMISSGDIDEALDRLSSI
jgi:threonine aldolase